MVANALVQTKPKFSLYLQDNNVYRTITSTLNSKDVSRFITATTSLVANNPALEECDYKTILMGALLGESLKLSPSPQLGQFYLAPFNDTKNNRKVAQFILGYKGYIQLAMRSGQYRDIDVFEIREGEYKGKDAFTGKPRIEFIEDDNERLKLPIIGYLAYFELLNGFRKSIYWTREKMEMHADKYSQAFSIDGAEIKTKYGLKYKVSFAKYLAGDYDKKDDWMYSSNWYKDFDGMAFKTMLRQLISKWGIMSIEFQTAVERDMAVIKDDMQPVYIDNPENEVDKTDTLPSPSQDKKEENQNDGIFNNFEE